MVSVKVSFEKQLQNERTLKIQVCLSAHTQVSNTLSESCFLLNSAASSAVHTVWLEAAVDLWAQTEKKTRK